MFKLHFTGLLLLSGLLFTPAPNPPMPAAVPTLISPANGEVMDNGCNNKSNGITWDFDWSDVPGARAYHIRVWRTNSLPALDVTTVPSSSYHFDKPTRTISNTQLQRWHWAVRARFHNEWGPWSSQRDFSVEKIDTDCP